MKILFCGTHPNLDSGYANVVYHLFSALQKTKKPSDQFVLFAFDAHACTLDRAKNLGMKIISPYRENKEAFGESMLAETVDKEKPDVVVIYNDLMVITRLLNSVANANHKPSKVAVYMDLVYDYELERLIRPILEQCNNIMLFTDDWKRHLAGYFPDYAGKMTTLNHGLRRDTLHVLSAVEIVEAKRDFGIPLDGITILNLNRNSWRKRWDLTVKSFIALLIELEKNKKGAESSLSDKVYLYVGCTLQRDNPAVTYNLADIIQTECSARGLAVDKIMSHFIFKGNRHFSDEDINRLYNACEIGLNTCSGEGFGLCNFEQGYIGRPQVVSRVGGLKTCLNGAYYVDPTGYQYSLEGVGGFAYDFDYLDFVKGLLLYCRDPAKRDEDGRRIREFIQSDSKYKWENIAQDFMKVWEK